MEPYIERGKASRPREWFIPNPKRKSPFHACLTSPQTRPNWGFEPSRRADTCALQGRCVKSRIGGCGAAKAKEAGLVPNPNHASAAIIVVCVEIPFTSAVISVGYPIHTGAVP